MAEKKTVDEVMRNHADRMRRIADDDRELTTTLATVHTGMVLTTGAHNLAKKGKALLESNKQLLYRLLEKGQRAQSNVEDPEAPGRV